MINPLEIAESPYYAELKSIKESTNEVGLYVYTITIMVNMEDAEFKFEQRSDKEIKKYFNAEMLGQDIDLSDMNCYTFSSKCDLDYQMEQAYISPDC